jgi:hypothetical protein
MLPIAPAHARFVAVLVAALAAGVGCTPSIGDACTQSTDCSVRGDRLCDTSMPGGYCTIFNCENNACPNDSMCVEFETATKAQTDRFARRFCMAPCTQASNCRAGYKCVQIGTASSPVDNDVNAVIVDTAPAHDSVCLP